MTNATLHWGSWLWVSAGAYHLSFMSSVPPLAAGFPWGKAVLIFLPVMVIVIFLCNAFKIYTDTPQGTAIWLPSSVLLTLALLWLFGFIPRGTILLFLIWGLSGLAGLFVLSLLLSSIVWLQERKSKRSNDRNGK